MLPQLSKRCLARRIICSLAGSHLMSPTTQHELQLARRMSRLGTETAFEVLNKARALERQGKSVVHLEIGDPDFGTPLNVVAAGVDPLRKGRTHYGSCGRLAGLRQALA